MAASCSVFELHWLFGTPHRHLRSQPLAEAGGALSPQPETLRGSGKDRAGRLRGDKSLRALPPCGHAADEKLAGQVPRDSSCTVKRVLRQESLH